MVCDVGDQDAVVASMAETIGELGRVDSCFVNAGVGGRGRRASLDMTVDEWRRVLRVNLDGAFYTAQEAVRHMGRPVGRGRRVRRLARVHDSGSAFFGQQRGQHYGGSKAAIIAMSKGIAVEHARYGVRSNAIVPGWIESDMTAGALHWDKFVERNMPRIPVRRWGEGKRLRRHRRLPRQPGQQLPHRRRHHDRRRLLQLLERPSTRSGQDPLRHVFSAYLMSVVRAPTARRRT